MGDTDTEQSGGQQDRRRRRSEETQQALQYQLDHVVEEFDMDMMLLADHQGTVVTSAGAVRLAEIFAAHAPNLVQANDFQKAVGAIIPDLNPDHVFCESISLDELPLYLCALMQPDDASRQGFDRARDGVQRIYYSTSELEGAD